MQELALTMGPGECDISGRFDNLTLDMTEGDVHFTATTMPTVLSIDSVVGDAVIDLPANDGFTLIHNVAEDGFTSRFHLVDINDQKAVYGKGAARLNIALADGALELV